MISNIVGITMELLYTNQAAIGTFPFSSDIDECKIPGKVDCGNGECKNIPGSFFCSCHIGYRFNRDRGISSTCVGM